MKKFLGNYRWSYVLLVAIIVIQAFYLFFQDPTYVLILGAALLPGIFYLAYVRYSDVGKREPRGVIALHILLGIIVIFPAIYLEGIGIGVLLNLGFSPYSLFDVSAITFWVIFAIFIVAPVEEGLKLFASLLGNRFHKENDEATDSIVYTVSVAAGFALFENYRYVFNSLGDISQSESLILAIARSFTAIPLHLGMGLLMGYFLSGYFHPRKFKLGKLKRIQLLWRAFLFPTIFHGLYDLIVFLIFFNFTVQVSAALLFTTIVTIYAWRHVKQLRETGTYNYSS